MVDVTIDNFALLRPQIEAELKEALFVAIDTEFTCLLSKEKFSNQFFDTGSERYSKLRQNLDQVAINQLGLAICLRVPDGTHYQCRVYNIYIGAVNFLDLDSTMLCQASSLAFLAQHGFDFNKWVYSGVPHLSQHQRQAASDRLAALKDGTGHINFTHVVKDAVREVIEWGSTAKPGDEFTVEDPLAASVTSSSPTFTRGYRDPSMSVAVVATINNICPNLLAAQMPDGLVLVVCLTAGQKEELADTIEYQWRELTDERLDKLSGVSHLLWKLADLQKPVMVHNGLTDLMLLYKQFFGPLPFSVEVFKKQIHKTFPMVYDTKILAHSLKRENKKSGDVLQFLNQTNLAVLAASLINCNLALFKPSLVIAPVDHKYRNKAFLHEAGYDAYLTAHCFLQLAHLGYSLKLPHSVLQRALEPREHVTALKHLANKINVMRAAIFHLDLDGPDKEAPRPPWLIVENLSERRTAIAEKEIAQYNELLRGIHPKPDDPRIQQFTTPDIIREMPEPKTTLLPSLIPEMIRKAGIKPAGRMDANANLIKEPEVIKPGVRPKFTPDCVAALLSRFGAVDVRPWRRNKMLVAAASFDAHQRMLTDLRVPSLKVYPYSAFKHSLLARSAMWSSLCVSGGLSAYLLYSCLKTDK